MQFRRTYLLLVSELALIGILPAPVGAQVSLRCETGRDGVSRCHAVHHGHSTLQNDKSNPDKGKTGQQDDDDGPMMTNGLKVLITRGGSYCIREIAVDGKLRCQSEDSWAKEGITFKHTISKLP